MLQHNRKNTFSRKNRKAVDVVSRMYDNILALSTKNEHVLAEQYPTGRMRTTASPNELYLPHSLVSAENSENYFWITLIEWKIYKECRFR